MDGDGLPEIAFQCYAPDTLHVHEYTDGSYPTIAEVDLPGNLNTNPMIIDDMEHGDVNGDGRDDIVFCGNSGQGHVLTYTDGTYDIKYLAGASERFSNSQTCSAGDITGDGTDDMLVVNQEGAKVYSYDNGAYQEVWVGPYPTTTPGIGASFIGDADNDGEEEFLFLDGTAKLARLYESDYVNSVNFGPTISSYGTIIVSNLNPNNDGVPVDTTTRIGAGRIRDLWRWRGQRLRHAGGRGLPERVLREHLLRRIEPGRELPVVPGGLWLLRPELPLRLLRRLHLRQERGHDQLPGRLQLTYRYGGQLNPWGCDHRR
jgi:hypothetical protein